MKRTRKLKERVGFSIGSSSLGHVLVATCAPGILAILIEKSRKPLMNDLESRFPGADLSEGEWESHKALAHVLEFIDKPGMALDWPVFFKGTHFQKQVWQAVQAIPAGRTVTYKDIAIAIGKPRAMRAVGNACSKVHLNLVVPCHRILRGDQTQPCTGYRRMLMKWDAAHRGKAKR